jgi:hypothetical protein
VSSASYFVSPQQLWSRIGIAQAPVIFDCDRRSARDDDHGLLERCFMVYDALLAWSRHAAEERHNWPAKAA